MNLNSMKDHEILHKIKTLVQDERKLLTQILHHLRVVERRKLFSDLECQSLFEYCVKELGYSEGQAGRRIQAMRLLKEIPEIEDKIKTGKLSLSNLSQAQAYFRQKGKPSVKEKKFGKKRVRAEKTTPTSEKQCGSKRNLNWDHIKPYAFGGSSDAKNVRLLCHNCNQREAIKSFGLKKIERYRSVISRSVD